jgi:hypothetical protein
MIFSRCFLSHWSAAALLSGRELLALRTVRFFSGATASVVESVFVLRTARLSSGEHFPVEAPRICYFAFDLLISNGRDLTKLPLSERWKLLVASTLRSTRLKRIPAEIRPAPGDDRP